MYTGPGAPSRRPPGHPCARPSDRLAASLSLLSVWLFLALLARQGAYANCAFVSHAGELVTPPFEDILSGTSVRWAMVLAKELVGGASSLLSKSTVRDITVEEAKGCAEMIVLGGAYM
eukprot:SAG22_NODE_4688_length_1192_cov_1.446478_3_plen_118_part_00